MWGTRTESVTIPGAGEPELEAFDPDDRESWRWIQPRRARWHWRLLQGARTVATLDRRGGFGTGSVARFRNATWRFRRQLPLDLLVVPEGSEQPIARFRSGWLAGGRMLDGADAGLLWRPTNFWCTRWALMTPDRLPLLRFHERQGFFKVEASLEPEDAARRNPSLALWTALGWHLLVHRRRHHDG